MAGLAQWRTPRTASGHMSRRLFHSGASVVRTNLDAEHDGIAAALIVGALHVDMDAMPDASLVRVTTYITWRQYSHIVTCAHGYMHADNDGDLCVGRIAQTLWGPAIGWVSSGPGSSGSLMECSDPHYKQREDGPGL